MEYGKKQDWSKAKTVQDLNKASISKTNRMIYADILANTKNEKFGDIPSSGYRIYLGSISPPPNPIYG